MAVKSSHGRRPPGTSSGRPTGTAGPAGPVGAPTAGPGRIGTARGTTAGARPVTGMADGVNRPMTGIRGAGFPGTAAGSRTGGLFDPLNQAARARGGSPGLDARREETPEDKIKSLEKKVNELIEESCFASGRGIILYKYILGIFFTILIIFR